jgi:hypothetical protein
MDGAPPLFFKKKIKKKKEIPSNKSDYPVLRPLVHRVHPTRKRNASTRRGRVVASGRKKQSRRGTVRYGEN